MIPARCGVKEAAHARFSELRKKPLNDHIQIAQQDRALVELYLWRWLWHDIDGDLRAVGTRVFYLRCRMSPLTPLALVQLRPVAVWNMGNQPVDFRAVHRFY